MVLLFWSWLRLLVVKFLTDLMLLLLKLLLLSMLVTPHPDCALPFSLTSRLVSGEESLGAEWGVRRWAVG